MSRPKSRRARIRATTQLLRHHPLSLRAPFWRARVKVLRFFLDVYGESSTPKSRRVVASPSQRIDQRRLCADTKSREEIRASLNSIALVNRRFEGGG